MFDPLVIFLKELFENYDFEKNKNQQMEKKHEIIQVMGLDARKSVFEVL